MNKSRYVCCKCGHSSALKSNFKLTNDGKVYCIKKCQEVYEYMQMVRDQIQRDLDEVEPRYKQGLKGARNLLFQNLTGNAMGTLAGMVGVLSQDAFSEAPKVARVNTPRTMGKGYYDYLNWNNNKALRSTASAALENTGDYGRAMSYIGNALGQTVNAK